MGYGGGAGGGGIIVLGPAHNLFGATSGDAQENPLTVNPATNRSAAETVRDNYANANASWLAEYDADDTLNIRLYFVESSENVIIHQFRQGSSWVDSNIVVAVQGVAGAVLAYDDVDPYELPMVGASPDKDPAPSGLRRITSGTGAFESDETMMFPRESIQIGYAGVLSGVGALIRGRSFVTDRTYIIPFQYYDETDGSERTSELSFPGPTETIVQSVDTSTMSATGSFNYTTTANDLITDIKIKSTANTTINNFRFRVTIQGSTDPYFYYPSKGKYDSGDGIDVTSDADGIIDIDISQAPMLIPISMNSFIEYAGTGGSLLGNGTIPYFSIMRAIFAFNTLARLDDVTAKEDSLGNPTANGYVLSSTTAGVRSWVNKENHLGNPGTNGYVLASQTTGTRSWVDKENNLGTPSSEGQALVSTVAGTRSWVSKENSLGNPGVNGYVLSSQIDGTRSWVAMEGGLGNPSTDGYVLSSTTTGTRSWVDKEDALGNPTGNNYVLASTTTGTRSWVEREPALGDPASDGQLLSSTAAGVRSWVNAPEDLGNPGTDGYVLSSTAAGVRSWVDKEDDLGNPGTDGYVLSSTAAGVRSWVDKEDDLGNPGTDDYVLVSTAAGVRSWVDKEDPLGNPSAMGQCLTSSTDGTRSWTAFEGSLGNPSVTGQVLTSTIAGVRSWITSDANLGNPGTDGYLLSSTIAGVRSWVAPGEPVLGNPSQNNQILASQTDGTRSWITSDTNLGNPSTDGYVLSSTIAGVRSWIDPGEPDLGNPTSDGDVLSSTTTGTRSWVTREASLGNPSTDGQILSSTTAGVRSWITSDSNLGNPGTDGQVLSSTTAGVRSWVTRENSLGNPTSDGQLLSSTTAGVRSWITSDFNLGNPTSDGQVLSSTTAGVRSWVNREASLGTPATDGQVLASTTSGTRSWVSKEDSLGNPISNNQILSSTTTGTRSWINPPENLGNPSNDGYLLSSTVAGTRSWVAPGEPVLGNPAASNYVLTSTTGGTRSWVPSDANLGNPGTDGYLLSSTAAGVRSWVAPGEPALSNPASDGQLLSSTAAGVRSWVAAGENDLGNPTSDGQILSSTTAGVRSWINVDVSLGNPSTDGYVLSSTVAGVRSWIDPGEPDLGNPGTDGQVLSSTTAGVRSWVDQTDNLGMPDTDGYLLSSTTAGTRSWVAPGEPALGNPAMDNYLLSSTAAGVRSWVAAPATSQTMNLLNANLTITSSNISTYNKSLIYTADDDTTNRTITINNGLNIDFIDLAVIGTGDVTVSTSGSEEIDGGSSVTYNIQRNNVRIKRITGGNYETIFSNVGSYVNNLSLSSNTLTLTQTGNAANVTQDLSSLIGEPALGNPGTDNYLLSSTVAGTRSWVAPGEPALGNPGTNGYLLSSTTAGARSWAAPGEPALGNPSTDNYVLASTTTGTRSWVPQTGETNAAIVYKFDTVTARDNHFATQGNRDTLFRGRTLAHLRDDGNSNILQQVWTGTDQPTSYDADEWLTLNDNSLLAAGTVKTLYESNSDTNAFTDAYNTILSKLSYSSTTDNINGTANINLEDHNFKFGEGNTIIEFGRLMCLQRDAQSDTVFAPVVIEIDTSNGNTVAARSYTLTSQTDHEIIGQSDPRAYLSGTLFSYVVTHTENFFVTKLHFYTGDIAPSTDLSILIFRGNTNTAANLILSDSLASSAISPNSKFTFTLDPVLEFQANQQYLIQLNSTSFIMEINSTENKFRYDVDRFLIDASDIATESYVTTQLTSKEDSLGNPSTDDYVLSSTAAGTRSWVDPNTFLQSNTFLYREFATEAARDQYYNITANTNAMVRAQTTAFVASTNTNNSAAIYMWGGTTSPTNYDSSLWVKVDSLKNLTLDTTDDRIESTKDIYIDDGFYSYGLQNEIIDYGEKLALKRNSDPDDVIIPVTQTIDTTDYTTTDPESYSITNQVKETIFAASVPASYTSEMSHTFLYTPTEDMYVTKFYFWCRISGVTINDEIEFTIYKGTSLTNANRLTKTLQLYNIPDNSEFSFTLNETVRLLANQTYYIWLESVDNSELEYNTTENKPRFSVDRGLITTNTLATQTWTNNKFDPSDVQITADVTISSSNLSTYNRAVAYTASTESTNRTVTFAENTSIEYVDFIVQGTGNLTIATSGSDTINDGSSFVITDQNVGVRVKKIGTEYIVSLSSEDTRVTGLSLSNGTLSLTQNNNETDVTESLTPLLDRTQTEITADITLTNNHSRNIIYNSSTQTSDYTININTGLTLEEFDVITLGTGDIIIDPGTGVTINGSTNNYTISDQNSGVHFIKIGENYVASLTNDEGSTSTVSSLTLANGTLTLAQSGGSDVTEDLTPLVDRTLTEISANLTLANTHNRNIIYNGASETNNYTISIDSGLTIQEFQVVTLGTGNITVDPGTGVTINGSTDNFVISDQKVGVQFVKFDEDYVTSLTNIEGQVSSLSLSSGTLTLAQTSGSNVTEDLTPLLEQTRTEITANISLANTNERHLFYNSSSQTNNYTITVPTGLTINTFDVLVLGTGDITLDPAVGITINGSTDNYVISDQRIGVHFERFGTDYVTSLTNIEGSASTVSSLTLSDGTLTLAQSGASDVTESLTPLVDRTLTEISANTVLANTHNRNIIHNGASETNNYTISIATGLTIKEFEVVTLGTGDITIDPGTGVTINGSTDNYVISDQNVGVHFVKFDENYITSLSNIEGEVSSLSLSNGTLTLTQSSGSNVTEDLEPLLEQTRTEITANTTLANTHERNLLYNSSSQTNNYTITVPTGLTLDTFDVLVLGTGDITLDPAVGITINGSTDNYVISDQRTGVHFERFGADYVTTLTNIEGSGSTVSSLTLSNGTLTLAQSGASDVTEDLDPLLTRTQLEISADLTLANTHNRNIIHNSSTETNNHTISISTGLTLNEFDVITLGTGDITIDPGTGVTVNGSTDNYVVSEQNVGVHFVKIGEDYTASASSIEGSGSTVSSLTLSNGTLTLAQSQGGDVTEDLTPIVDRTLTEITANLTLTNNHHRNVIYNSSSQTNNYTISIPSGLTLDEFEVITLGTGDITIDPGTGVTVNGSTNNYSISDQNSGIHFQKIGEDYITSLTNTGGGGSTVSSLTLSNGTLTLSQSGASDVTEDLTPLLTQTRTLVSANLSLANTHDRNLLYNGDSETSDYTISIASGLTLNEFDVVVLGTGNLIIDPGVGVTVNGSTDNYTISDQLGAVHIEKFSEDYVVTLSNDIGEPELGNPGTDGYLLSSTTTGTRSWAAPGEPALGNPGTDGYLLSSTTTGTRSWAAPGEPVLGNPANDNGDSINGLTSTAAGSRSWAKFLPASQPTIVISANLTEITTSNYLDYNRHLVIVDYTDSNDRTLDIDPNVSLDYFDFVFLGTGSFTLRPDTSEQIDGLNTIVIQTRFTFMRVKKYGSRYYSQNINRAATEPYLGNPGTNGYVLASQTDGTRSWIQNAALTYGATSRDFSTVSLRDSHYTANLADLVLGRTYSYVTTNPPVAAVWGGATNPGSYNSDDWTPIHGSDVMTDANVKTKYENNSNTNVFDNNQKTIVDQFTYLSGSDTLNVNADFHLPDEFNYSYGNQIKLVEYGQIAAFERAFDTNYVSLPIFQRLSTLIGTLNAPEIITASNYQVNQVIVDSADPQEFNLSANHSYTLAPDYDAFIRTFQFYTGSTIPVSDVTFKLYHGTSATANGKLCDDVVLPSSGFTANTVFTVTLPQVAKFESGSNYYMAFSTSTAFHLEENTSSNPRYNMTRYVLTLGDVATTTQVNAKEDALGNPVTNNYVLASQTDGTRSWVANAGETLGNPTSDGQVLSSTTTGTRSWVDREASLGNPGTDNYLLSSTIAGTRSWVAPGEPALGNPAADDYILSSSAAGTRSWVALSSMPMGLTLLNETGATLIAGTPVVVGVNASGTLTARHASKTILGSGTDVGNAQQGYIYGFCGSDIADNTSFIPVSDAVVEDCTLAGSASVTVGDPVGMRFQTTGNLNIVLERNSTAFEALDNESSYGYCGYVTAIGSGVYDCYLDKDFAEKSHGDRVSGGGEIDVSGTPTANQVTTWVDNNTVQGVDQISADVAYREVAISASVSITSETLYDQYVNKIITVDGNTSGIIFTLPSLVSRASYTTGGDRFGLRHTGAGSNTVTFKTVTDNEDISDRTDSVTISSGESILVEIPETGLVYKDIKHVANSDNTINQIREVTEFYIDTNSDVGIDNGLRLHNILSTGSANVNTHVRDATYDSSPISLEFMRLTSQHDLSWIMFWSNMVTGVPIPTGEPHQILGSIQDSLDWIDTNIIVDTNFQFDAFEGTNTATAFTFTSGNNVRISLSSSLDDIITTGHSIEVTGSTNSVHNGTFTVSEFNSGNNTVDVTNPAVSDASDNVTGQNAVFTTPIYADVTAIDHDMRTVTFNLFKDTARVSSVTVNSNWFNPSNTGSESRLNITYTNNVEIDPPDINVEDITEDFYRVNSGSKKFIHYIDNTSSNYVGVRYLPLNHEIIHIATSGAASCYFDLNPADLADGEMRRYTVYGVDTNSFTHLEIFAGRAGTNNQITFDEGINGIHVFPGTSQVFEFYNDGTNSGVRLGSPYQRTILSALQDTTAATLATGLQPVASSEISTVTEEDEDPTGRFYSISSNKILLKVATEYEITFSEQIRFASDEDTGPSFINFSLLPQRSRSGQSDKLLYNSTGTTSTYLLTLRNGNNSGDKPTVMLNTRIVYKAVANDEIGFNLTAGPFPGDYTISDFERLNRIFTITVRGGIK